MVSDLICRERDKKIDRDDQFAFLSLFTLVNKHQKQTNTTMDPTSDPLDVAVALAQAMGPTETTGGGGDTSMPASDPTTPNKDKLLGGLMSPHDALLSASNQHMNMPMFTTTCNDTSPPQPQQPQQSELVDPLDTNSCLSLLQTSVNPQSQPNINNTSTGIPSTFGLSFDKAWQMPLGWQQSNAAAPNQGITSTASAAGIFFPPTPPVESPATGNHQHSSSLAFTQQQQQQQQHFPPPWLGMTPSHPTHVIPSTHTNNNTTLGKQHQSPPEMNPFDMSSLWPFPPPPQPNMNRANRHSIAIGSNLVDNNNAITKPSSTGRRKSTPGRTYRRRTSSQPSVASVVSLSAHEPVAHTINGIEHITFLYSHDRLVKEYTVRTDAANCPLEDIPLDFRMVNAVSITFICIYTHETNYSMMIHRFIHEPMWTRKNMMAIVGNMRPAVMNLGGNYVG